MTGPLAIEHRTERDLLAGLSKRLVGFEACIHRILAMQAQLREELDQMRDELNSELELIQDQLAKNVNQTPPFANWQNSTLTSMKNDRIS